MAKPRMDLTSFIGKLLEQDDVDALREGVRILAQAVMETEVSSQIGALPYERSSDRSAYRNGSAPAPGTLVSAPSSSRSPRSRAAPIFPACSSPVGAPRGRCTRSWSRPTSRA
jgi:putative transposase